MATKAYVSSSGKVLSKKRMNQYAINSDGTESNQLPPDTFLNKYSNYGLINPLYNLEALAQLPEMNSYHYRAVKTKARDVAGLGWKLEPSDELDDDQEPDEDQKELAMELLKRPNQDDNLSEMNDKVMVDFESTGNGYHEVVRDDDGYIARLEHVPSHTVRRHSDTKRYVQQRGVRHVWFKKFGHDKDVDYRTGDEYELEELDEKYRATEILDIKNYTSRSDYYGLPDIVPALGSILGDREAQEYNISFFENHAVPAYAVTVSGTELDEETEKKIEKFFKQDLKEDPHSTIVLSAQKDEADDNEEPIKFEFEALSTDTKEASFRQYRQDNRDEILSAHGVPPYRAGVTVEGQLGGSSAEESTEIYKQSVIKPRQEMLENQINRHILGEGLEITDWQFKFEEIDTRDVQKEIDQLKELMEMAVYTPNGILEYLGHDKSDNEYMDKRYYDGEPLEALNEPDQFGGDGGQAMMSSVKDLHRELMTIATKGNGEHDKQAILKSLDSDELKRLYKSKKAEK